MKDIDNHRTYLYAQWNDRFETLEDMVDEFRNDGLYSDNPSAMRAISIALTNLQTARMWVNKALYSNKENNDNASSK